MFNKRHDSHCWWTRQTKTTTVTGGPFVLLTLMGIDYLYMLYYSATRRIKTTFIVLAYFCPRAFRRQIDFCTPHLGKQPASYPKARGQKYASALNSQTFMRCAVIKKAALRPAFTRAIFAAILPAIFVSIFKNITNVVFPF